MYELGTKNMKDGRKVRFFCEGAANIIYYSEIIPGYSNDCGRYGERHFEGEITQKDIKEYMKEVMEELREPL